MFELPMPSSNFRFPGVLNSQELLVAEAVQARVWAAIGHDDRLDTELESEARDRLGRIILRLMSNASDSVSDLTSAAVAEFEATRPTIRIALSGPQRG